MKKIFKMIGMILLYFFTYLVAGVMVGIALGIVLVVKYIAGNPGFTSKALGDSIQSTISQNTNLILVFTSILSFIFFWVVFVIRKKKFIEECSFSKISIKNIGLIAVAGISYNIFVALLISYAVSFAPVKTLLPGYEKVSVSLFSGNLFWMILGICIIVPAFEEIFFRSILFNELKKNMPLALAVILQAALFGLFHMNWIQGSYAFILGVVFSLVLVWTRSIWAPILMHMFFNTTSLVLNMLPNKEALEQFGIVFVVLGLLIFITAIFFIYKDRKVITDIPVDESVSM
jgi:CAAX amino terminal protease family.